MIYCEHNQCRRRHSLMNARSEEENRWLNHQFEWQKSNTSFTLALFPTLFPFLGLFWFNHNHSAMFCGMNPSRGANDIMRKDWEIFHVRKKGDSCAMISNDDSR